MKAIVEEEEHVRSKFGELTEENVKLEKVVTQALKQMKGAGVNKRRWILSPKLRGAPWATCKASPQWWKTKLPRVSTGARLHVFGLLALLSP